MAWPKFLRALFAPPAPPVAIAPPSVPVTTIPPPTILLAHPDPDPDPPTSPTARDPDLEAALVAGPHDPAVFSVYADWLTERGDVRGEWIAIAIALAADPDNAAIAGQQGALEGDHERHLYGPLFADLEDPYAAFVTEELGYVRVLSLVACKRAHLPAIRAHLADAAGLLVHTIHAPTWLHAALAPLVAGRTPAVALVDPEAPAGPLAGRLRVERMHEDDRILYATFGCPAWAVDRDEHAVLVRTTLELPDGTRHVWTNGTTTRLLEEGGAFPIETGAYALPAGSWGSARIAFEVQVASMYERDDEPTSAAYAGSLAVSSEPGQHAIELALGAAPVGAPFDAVTPVDTPAVVRGPLRAFVDDSSEAIAIPGVGVFEPSRIVRFDGSRVELAQEGEAHVAASSSPNGDIVAVLTRTADAYTLTAIAKPASAKPRIHRAQLEGDEWTSVVALTAERIAILGPRRAVLADAQARIVWRGATAARDAPGVILDRDTAGHERLTIAGDDVITFTEQLTRAETTPLLMVGLPSAEAPATYDPRRDRAIWLRCLDDDDRDARRLLVVAWRDGDGPQREVYLRDRRCAPDDDDGITVIPEDGRIIAIGQEHAWLVDPRTASVARLGPRGRYQKPPLVTRTPEGRYRLWNGGAGPWYLELA